MGEHIQPISIDLERIGKAIIDAGLKVHIALGPGLLESAYEHCLAHELTKRGHDVRRQVGLPITYDEMTLEVGYRVDLLIDASVIVEVKGVDQFDPVHQAQLLTYLKLSSARLGYLLNFNVQLFKNGIKRCAL